MNEIIKAVWITVLVYLPAWFAGVIIALLLSAIVWFLGKKASKVSYLIFGGISFIPVTVLLPYFLRGFGLSFFVYPLLSFPCALVMFSSFHEAFNHCNRSRQSLLRNYGMNRLNFFLKILLRESVPSLHTSLRFTLSLSFAIFLALDYFMESWGGLGSLVRFYYNRLLFNYESYNILMALTVFSAGIIGSIQVALLSLLLKPFTEFRKHY